MKDPLFVYRTPEDGEEKIAEMFGQEYRIFKIFVNPFLPAARSKRVSPFQREYSKLDLVGAGNVKEMKFPLIQNDLICGVFMIKKSGSLEPCLGSELDAALESVFAHFVALGQSGSFANAAIINAGYDYSAVAGKIIEPTRLIAAGGDFGVFLQYVEIQLEKLAVLRREKRSKIGWKNPVKKCVLETGSKIIDSIDADVMNFRLEELGADDCKQVIFIPFEIFQEYGKAFPSFRASNAEKLYLTIVLSDGVLGDYDFVVEHARIEAGLIRKFALEDGKLLKRTFALDKRVIVESERIDVSGLWGGGADSVLIVVKDIDGKLVDGIEEFILFIDGEPMIGPVSGGALLGRYSDYLEKSESPGYYFFGFGATLNFDDPKLVVEFFVKVKFECVVGFYSFVY